MSSVFACTEDEANNKRMAIERVQQAMVIESSNDDEEKTLTKMLHSLVDDMQVVNKNYLVKKEYDNACREYDNIIEKYNIDMDKATDGMLTMEELKADGGKKGGSCSIVEASAKMTKSVGKMQKLMESADIAMEEFLEFNKRHEKIMPLMTTNPSSYCDQLDEIVKTYTKY